MTDIRPHAGPQQAFLSTAADVCVYGGAAGGGKTFALLLDAARYTDVPGFTGVFFRRTYPQIIAPDGLWALSCELYPALGGKPRENTHEWRFPSGSRLVMSHLQYDRDVISHQGAQYCGIWWDELTHFTARQFWYLLSRNRTTTSVRPFMRATCNPDPDSFVADFIAHWLDDDGLPIERHDGALRWFVRDGGELVWADEPGDLRARIPGVEPLSATFIASRLEDNPTLVERDPGYRSRLESLQMVERARLLDGNWRIRASAGTFFRAGWFRVFDELPGAVQAAVRGWDKAATAPHAENRDPDWTQGVRIVRLGDGAPVRYVVTDVASLRGNPGEVDRLMVATASQDGRSTTQAIWQDPGQAGVVDVQHTRRVLEGHAVVAERSTQNKEAYAAPLSSAAEGGLVGLMRGPWNRRFLDELAAFPEGRHDDQVDGASLAFRRLTAGGSRRAGPSASEGASKWRR
ncbi:MAG: terminase [Gammaproteobacteria bacterium]|nr:terminase [Gammaproteobacteria bacterium]NIV51107.1 terminase [Gammaproteobacteria bacterium]NIW23960.1 terminase [Gammaproteobacteria bacterium]NIX85049.1 terminase [Gammaproteobacteria bacterium]